MSNVIQLSLPRRLTRREDRFTSLMGQFACERRDPLDVYWLKENAELLNILLGTGAQPEEEGLAVYGEFYETIRERVSFFPQYYRFYLSLALDLEDLGMQGSHGEELVDWVRRDGAADGELSDLQRLEARRLMLRRGVDPLPHDTGLEARLRAFAATSATFSRPNRKAAYELTHIIFYLSEYGQRDPAMDEQTTQSLHFAGLLAWLDEDADLLAEICIALRFAGKDVPKAWENWCGERFAAMQILPARSGVQDQYHEYLVGHWAHHVAGGRAFDQVLPEGALAFHLERNPLTPLRALSHGLLNLGAGRIANWTLMRQRLQSQLSEETLIAIDAAATSSPQFDAFFNGFARADICGAAA